MGLIGEGIARFRGFGGKRAVLTNVRVRVDDGAPSAAGPDDPFDLVGPRAVVRERLAHVKALGFDDLVLVARPARHRVSRGAPRARVTAAAAGAASRAWGSAGSC